MDKKNIEALLKTINEKPKISGTEGNLADKGSLNKAAFKKLEIAGIKKNREYKNAKTDPAFRESKIAGMEKNLELKRDLSFESPEFKEKRIASISGNLYGNAERISREYALREKIKRTLPPKEQARFINAPSIKMDLQNFLTKSRKKNENSKNQKTQAGKGTFKRSEGR